MKIIPLMLLLSCTLWNQAFAEQLNNERKTELTHLLRHDCGSCHGMTLKGGLGPALTPDVLENKPKEYLFHVIRHGRPNTPMPPWQGILSDEEIQWLVGELKQGIDS